MPSIHEMAFVARKWLKEHQVHRYRMKKVSDMTDHEVLQKCHWWNEENHLTREFSQYECNKLYSTTHKSEV